MSPPGVDCPATHAATPNSESELWAAFAALVAMEDAADSLAALFGSKLSLQTPIHATPHDRRKSAVSVPESHPVSPAGSDGGASTADDAGSSGGCTPGCKAAGTGTPARGPRSPTSPPATSHFSIPAMRAVSLTPAMALPASLPATATEERVTLNLFIDSGTPLASSSAAKHAAAAAAASEEASCLRAELDALRAQALAGEQRRQQEADQLRAELNAVRAEAALASEQQAKATAEQAAEAQQAAAAVEDQQAGALAAAAAVDSSAGVNLVIHVADLPALVEQQPALTEPVQLVLHIIEPPLHSPGDAGTSTSSAAPAAGAAAAHLQQQLARAEACREELARQAGQLKGRIAKVGTMQTGTKQTPSLCPPECDLPGRLPTFLPASLPACPPVCTRSVCLPACACPASLTGLPDLCARWPVPGLPFVQLEGAALAGESRVKAQATELEGLKAANRELQAALEAAQVGASGPWTCIDLIKARPTACKCAVLATEGYAGQSREMDLWGTGAF